MGFISKCAMCRKTIFFLTKPFLAVFIGILAFPCNACISLMTLGSCQLLFQWLVTTVLPYPRWLYTTAVDVLMGVFPCWCSSEFP